MTTPIKKIKPKAAMPDTDSNTHIYRTLFRAIHEHHLLPDTHLPEDELAKSFSVSRTRIRQVLERLTHEQLVVKVKNKGCFVASMSAEQVKEVFEARQLLELAILQSLPLPLADDDLQSLRQLCMQERQALQSADYGLANTLSGEFHIQLVAQLGNNTLTTMVKQLIARSSLAIGIYSNPDIMQCDNGCHDHLLDLLQHCDYTQAVQFMQKHLQDLQDQLLIKTQTPKAPDFAKLIQQLG